MEEQEILVCRNCGKNGDEVDIEVYSHYMEWVDKFGEHKCSEVGDVISYHCCGCDSEINENLITVGEYKALARDKQIDSIIED